ncbi:MerR family DNA-binding transcriptional regulator [Agarivorans aestuarii]|uniref:MerR family DNA-binding transcriptional regulator n=1 Tax=Agarivorans aestuarii TaxID=1563703 RepID=A0ABU7G0R0_9ALTE|nr:MerR family DNA-binding transcriptional regulator [Agarivorans aestuarii]MEE1672915.1 MerR family DNA-binding transcriptional regulator [Agarivorans aestuarii]
MVNNPTPYSISDLAQEFTISTRSIRFYEDQGLLQPVRDGTKRLYSKHDKLRLKLILRGKRLGFSLKEIKELFDLYDAKLSSSKEVEGLIGSIKQRKLSLLQQLEDIQVVLMELKSAERRCNDALQKLNKD